MRSKLLILFLLTIKSSLILGSAQNPVDIDGIPLTPRGLAFLAEGASLIGKPCTIPGCTKKVTNIIVKRTQIDGVPKYNNIFIHEDEDITLIERLARLQLTTHK